LNGGLVRHAAELEPESDAGNAGSAGGEQGRAAYINLAIEQIFARGE
jgi:hypothetical protein